MRFINKNKRYLYVLGANGVSLVIGAIISFLIPYFLNITDYGYYKQFTLYLTYIGLMHFGFNDGIYLEYGAYNYEDLPKEKFRMYFRYLLLQQFIMSFILFSFIFLFFNNIKFFSFSFVVLNMICLNLIRYFSYISQITQRFKLYSVTYVLEKCGLMVPLIFFFFTDKRMFEFVIVFQTFVYITLVLFFILFFKDLIFGRREKQNKKEIGKILKIGYSLMLGNFILIMIFNIDRVMIDMFLPIEDFSIYSLAVQFLSIVLIFVSSFSKVIYPYLKRKSEKNYKDYHKKASIVMTGFVSLSLLLYFPIKFLVLEFLPQYKESMNIFLILLPAVALRGEIEIVFNNLFKSLKKQKVYFIIACGIFFLAILLNILLYNIFHSIYAFSIASFITFICWYVVSDIYLNRYFHVVYYKKYIYLVSIIVVYFISTMIEHNLLSMLCYILLSLIVFLIIYRKYLLYNFLPQLRSKKIQDTAS